MGFLFCSGTSLLALGFASLSASESTPGSPATFVAWHALANNSSRRVVI